MSAFAGRVTAVSFVQAKASDSDKTLAELAAMSWNYVGALRGKEGDTSWSPIDVTTSDSPDYTKESIVAFKEETYKADGVARNDEVFNAKLLRTSIRKPDSVLQGGEPYFWLKVVDPVFGTSYLFTLGTKFTVTSAHDDAIKFSVEFAVMNSVDSE